MAFSAGRPAVRSVFTFGPRIPKNNYCYPLQGWYVGRPFREGWAKYRAASPEGVNGRKCPAPMGAGGHNNTKFNPVFRGMVRR